MIAQHGTLRLSRRRFENNVNRLRQQIGPNARLCATIKANAYGHGAAPIAALLHAARVDWVCVYSLEEAATLPRLPWAGLLALAPFVMTTEQPLPPLVAQLLEGPLRVNLTDVQSARHLSHALAAAGVERALPVHIQIDTGLTRVGIDPGQLPALVAEIQRLPHLRLEGFFSHLSHGDVPGHATLQDQMNALRQLTQPLKEHHPHLLIHLQNSGGSFYLPSDSFDLVRAGITLYGLQPSTAAPIPGLLPIAELTAPILAIHERPANTGIGYGHTFVTGRHSRLAIVPVGYADGYPRAMTNRAIAQVGVGEGGGVDVPVVGRVSMDQIILDVTDVEGVRVGDVATVISWEAGKANSLDAMADAVGTIGYELATHLAAGGGRLERVIVE